ncbi:Ig-like domain-containing protein [Celeribacter halophilus]|uniref:Ig-like domain-containing protein n=1 Tax=Celeribacter halophilus TaxID=576117 RepID=A0AAW7XTB4_9RHOB|nr:Ig-like domain-containing protein [Celeribacter halophilus]MDO6456000.1 Ig-like domain-containing protein [Celeribacter halophilus]
MSNRILKASPDQVRVNLDIDQTGLETYARTGDDLVINLSTGDQITVQDFYVPASDGSLHSIVYSNDMMVEGDPTAAAGLGAGFSEEGIALAALGALGIAALAAGGGGGDDDDNDSEEAFDVNDDDDFVDTSTNSAEGNVLANDTGEGLVVTAEAGTTDLGGQFVVSENGDYVYTPPAAVEGSVDEFEYEVTDANGETRTGTVRIYVPSSQDDNPSIITNSDVVDLDKDVSFVDIEPLANDGDTDGDGVSDQNLIIVGAESVDGQGYFTEIDGETITYKPHEGAEPGLHVLTYTVQDQDTGETETQTIFVNVENKDPVAEDNPQTVAPDSEENAISADDLATDPDGSDSELTFTNVSADHGTVTLSDDQKTVYYAPDPGYEDKDTLSYTIVDEHGGTLESSVTVTVDPSLTVDTEEQGFLDPFIGEGGLLGFLTADGMALGEITGSEGLLGELVGSSSPLDDLSNELLGRPLLGDGVGEDGKVGILDSLIADEGLLGPVTGNDGLLGDITGSEGLLGDLLLTGGALGAVSGHEGLVGELFGTGLLGEDPQSDSEEDQPDLGDLTDALDTSLVSNVLGTVTDTIDLGLTDTLTGGLNLDILDGLLEGSNDLPDLSEVDGVLDTVEGLLGDVDTGLVGGILGTVTDAVEIVLDTAGGLTGGGLNLEILDTEPA